MTQYPEILCAMALSRAGNHHLSQVARLYQEVPSASQLFNQAEEWVRQNPAMPEKIKNILLKPQEHIEWAAQQLQILQQNQIQAICMADPLYPGRLKECNDAPPVIYLKGNANLNTRRIISIVGTRNATIYGEETLQKIIRRLQELLPDLLIVSGLAYGIDILAHRIALQNEIPTLAVMAHGHHTIYPATHRQTAQQMLQKGGILTEFTYHTQAEKHNFIQRNRIIAGIADLTLIIESAEKGGSLITAEMAKEYNRDVMAIPGPIHAKYSKGCNHLIRDNKAILITEAEDIIRAMNWTDDLKLKQAKKQGIQRVLFPQQDKETQAITDALTQNNDLHINQLATITGLGISILSAKLFQMEMNGMIKMLPGSTCHLLQ